jgi:hypothetical protein
MTESVGIDLPHEAWYDDETNTVSFSLDRVTLSFSLVEFFEFYKQLSDVAQVLGQMVDSAEEFCEECGVHTVTYEITPPDETEFH